MLVVCSHFFIALSCPFLGNQFDFLKQSQLYIFQPLKLWLLQKIKLISQFLATIIAFFNDYGNQDHPSSQTSICFGSHTDIAKFNPPEFHKN
jgi:hypothetical protein